MSDENKKDPLTFQFSAIKFCLKTKTIENSDGVIVGTFTEENGYQYMVFNEHHIKPFDKLIVPIDY